MKTKEVVLALLKESAGQSVSGEEIAAKAKVSRTAVWKAVCSLREEGYGIEGSTNRGYTLTGTCGKPRIEFIRRGMQGENCDIFVYEQLASTNDVALELIADGCAHGTCVIANSQTAGRGRTGRKFYSPAGTGIYLSIVLRRHLEAGNVLAVTPAAAVAVRRAAEKVFGLQPRIKWVNDLYMAGKKVCGILTQSLTDTQGRITGVTVGIGVNVARAAHLPQELENIAGALLDDVSDRERDRFIGVIISEMLNLCEQIPDRTFMKEYRDNSLVLNREVGYVFGGMEYTGIVRDIDRDGALIVEERGGAIRRINSGEVSIHGDFSD